MAEFSAPTPFLDEFVARRVEQQRMIDAEVKAAHADGHFATPDPLLAARAVITMCTATAQWFDPIGPLTPSDIAASYVDLALGLMRWSGPQKGS